MAWSTAGVSFVSFVNRRGFRLLLGKTVALLQGGKFEAVDAVEDAVKLARQAVVGMEIESAAQKLVEGGVEILLGGFEVPSTIVILP